MGSVIFDFLNESFLFDESLQEERFSSVSENDLASELEKYREHALSSLPVLREEITGHAHTLRIFGAQDFFSVDHLLQTAFYLDQVILPDPVLPYSRKESEISKTMSQFLGMNGRTCVDRDKLARSVRRMKALTPMVAANFVKFFPVSYYLEPDDPIRMSYSDTGFSDVLAKETLDAYRARAIVRSVRKSGRNWITEKDLQVGRAIAIHFDEEDDGACYIYNLLQQEIVHFDDATRTAHVAMTLPDNPPQLDEFDAWVNQSINQSAIAHYQVLLKGLYLSSSLDASFMTSSPFTHSLLGTNSSHTSIQTHTSECMLNVELPTLTNVSVEDLMSIRQNDGEAFDLFRRELESRLKELRAIRDPELLRIRMNDIIHEMADVEVAKINQKVRELRKGILASSVIAVGGLLGSVVTSGATLAGAAIALANGFKSYAEYREKTRENPAYFLWKLKKART